MARADWQIINGSTNNNSVFFTGIRWRYRDDLFGTTGYPTDRISSNTDIIEYQPFVGKKNSGNTSKYYESWRTSNYKYSYNTTSGNEPDVASNVLNISTTYRFDKASVNTTYYLTQGALSSTNVMNTSSTTTSRIIQVPHCNDGTSKLRLYFYFDGASGTSFNYAETNGVVTLETIPRASSITVNDANIDSSTNIVINKASDNFTTTLSYKASGQNSWTTIVTKTSNQVYGWTVPTSFYALIPNSRTISCEFKAETYDGNTLIGSATTTAIFTATGNPIIEGLIIHDMEQTTIDLTGNNTVLIKGYSDAEIEYEVTAQNGAGIKKITVNNETITYPSPQTTQIDMTDIANVTTNTFIFTVTDTRDYTTTETRTLQMIDYIPLTLNATIRRNTSTDGKINISFNGNYFDDDFGVEGNTLQVVSNTLSAQYRYKESTSSTWNNWTSLSATIGQDIYSGSTQISGFDYNKQYDFEIKAEDQLVTKTITGLRISKGEPVYWWNEEEFHVIKKLLADSYLRADSYVSPNGRISSANLTHQYPEDKVSKKLNISSSSMSTGKPASDGFIETYFWDNSGQYDTQLFLPNGDGNRPSVRTRGGGDNWSGSWRELAWKSDVPTKTSDLTNDSNFMVSDFITVCNNADQTIKGNNTAVKYNLNTVKSSSGNKVTFDSSNHGVAIGAGVNYVDVAGTIYVYTRGANSTVQAYIYKNSTQVARVSAGVRDDYVNVVIPSLIIPVSQGDKIYMYVRSSAGTNTNVVLVGNTDGVDYLTVKVIK